MAFITTVVEQWLERVIVQWRVKEASKSKWHALTLSNQLMLYQVFAKSDEQTVCILARNGMIILLEYLLNRMFLYININ